ncbi:uncharacterized protein [Physcomitrium patens]|uniref:Ribosomal protein n=1 Tax=Physcomitrium patens TaxID=3218 RepID=A0A2K1IV21_PHYPA|nr:uncharacterized protein LOC112272968 isoform X1 [Physcomitrium patens]PNR33124.1 hypothetical protein PHYPA_025067 [Physcomitrium patens]|eukprot:XP_024356979.1 uncharacterized protein LOC112272968 isoform X1 [Physcomitrella patens]
MAARLPLHRAFFLKSVSGSIPSLWALKITPLRSSVCSFSSDAKPDSSDPAPGFSPANVSTLDDVTVSASLIESGDALLTKPRVANLPEDLSLEALEAANRIPSPPEKVKPVIPLPSLIKLQKGTRQDPQLIVDAIRLVKENAKAKFTETVEAHVRLGIDPKRSDQMVRGAATLPNGSGKVVRVAVFAEGSEAQEALAAGADVVGADDLVDRIKDSGGKLDFDKCIATPSFMPRLGKVARILGPRGLMPNPKVGTVTNQVGEAVRAAKQGRVDFRADKSGIVHVGVGKVNFSDDALIQNISAFVGALLGAKPVGLKKTSRYAGYLTSFTLTSTMGKGVPVTINSVAQAADSYMKTAGVSS